MNARVARMDAVEEHTPPPGAEPGPLVPGSLSVPSGQFGLWAFLATVTMLFAGLTSAYLVRQTTGADWYRLPLPPVLYFNTVVLFASSLTLERARASLRRARTAALGGWLAATLALGLAFLLGQLLAWRRLAAYGLFLPTDPHASFFYVLTGVHAAHLLGGLAALAVTSVFVRRHREPLLEAHRLKLCSLYWHFVDGVWLYVFFVLFVL